MDIYELSAKMILGDELSVDEKVRVQKYNAKYELVRFLYMEKMNAGSSKVSQFYFTPGNKFIDIPTIDIVNELVKCFEGIDDGRYSREHNPTETGLQKRTLL
jgi:hypothetical protein